MIEFVRTHYLSLLIMGIRLSVLGIKFIFTLFVAKFLGTEALGIYGILAALFLTGPAFLSLSMNHSIARDAPIFSKEQTQQNISFYVLYLLGVYLILIPAFVIYGIYQNDPFFYLMMAVILLLEHINNNGYQLCQNLNHHILTNLMQFIRSALWMMIFMVITYLNPHYATIHIIMVSWLVGSAAAAIMLIYTVRDYINIQINVLHGFIPKMRKKYQENHYNFIQAQLYGISTYAGLAITELCLGTSQTGVYVFFMNICSALQNMIRTGIHQVARAHMITCYHQKDEIKFRAQVYDLSKKTVIYALLMALVTMPVLYAIVQYIIKDVTIANEMMMLPVILIAFVVFIQAEVYKISFYCARNDRVIFQQDGIMAVMTVLLSVPFCLYFGVSGAFSALLLSSLFYYYSFRTQAKKYHFI